MDLSYLEFKALCCEYQGVQNVELSSPWPGPCSTDSQADLVDMLVGKVLLLPLSVLQGLKRNVLTSKFKSAQTRSNIGVSVVRYILVLPSPPNGSPKQCTSVVFLGYVIRDGCH